jgi:hypothetical protein
MLQTEELLFRAKPMISGICAQQRRWIFTPMISAINLCAQCSVGAASTRAGAMQWLRPASNCAAIAYA